MALQWKQTVDGMDWHTLAAFYQAVPLGSKTADSVRISFSNSLHVCLVFDQGNLVGAGRVVGDGYDFAYLCDVAILPGYQGQGLGGEIVQFLLDQADYHQKILLYAVPGKEAFYQKFGFAKMKTAMARFANQPLAASRGYVEE